MQRVNNILWGDFMKFRFEVEFYRLAILLQPAFRPFQYEGVLEIKQSWYYLILSIRLPVLIRTSSQWDLLIWWDSFLYCNAPDIYCLLLIQPPSIMPCFATNSYLMTSLLGILICKKGFYFRFPSISGKIYYCKISGYGFYLEQLRDKFTQNIV